MCACWKRDSRRAAASDSKGAALKERVVESLAELADLHDDVEIVLVELFASRRYSNPSAHAIV